MCKSLHQSLFTFAERLMLKVNTNRFLEKRIQSNMDKSIEYKKTSKQRQDFKYDNKRKKNLEIQHQNQNIISQTIAELKLTNHSFILEIDCNNSRHLPFLFQQAKGIGYYGVSFSDKPMDEIPLVQVLKINEGHAEFINIKEGEKLNFESDFFDCCFTANTIYYWSDPLSTFKEIYRTLRLGGTFNLSFIEQKFGKDLPWTQTDFTFYTLNQIKTMYRIAGFGDLEVIQMTEEVMTKDGQHMVRPFIYISGRK